MTTFNNSGIYKTNRRLSIISAPKNSVYSTQLFDDLILEKIRVVSTDNSKKDRLSQMGRSTYGPQKLHRKK